MKLKIGDKVIIRAEAEEMQNALFQEIDGAAATVTEVYQNDYEPGVFRIEVQLESPVEIHGEEIKIVPGLYMDNVEKIERVRESHRTGGWFSAVAVNKFSRWNRLHERNSSLGLNK